MLKKIIIIFFLFFLLFPGNILAQEIETTDNSEDKTNQLTSVEETEICEPLQSYYLTALVTALEEKEIKIKEDDFTTISSAQEITIKILSKKFKDQEFIFINELTNNPLDIKVKQGDEIIINLEIYDSDNYKIFLVDYFRFNSLLLLTLLFFLIVLLIGGKQGQKTILSLIISIILIFKILIPLTLKGYNPIALALSISLIIIIISYLLISCYNKRQWLYQ